MNAPFPHRETSQQRGDRLLVEDREIRALRARAEAAADRIGAGRWWVSVRRGELLREAKARGVNVAQVERYGGSVAGALIGQDSRAIRTVAAYDRISAVLNRGDRA